MVDPIQISGSTQHMATPSIHIDLGDWGRQLWGAVLKGQPQQRWHWSRLVSSDGACGVRRKIGLGICLAWSTHFLEAWSAHRWWQSKGGGQSCLGSSQTEVSVEVAPKHSWRPPFQTEQNTLPMRRALHAPRKHRNRNRINKLEQFQKNFLGSVWPEGRIEFAKLLCFNCLRLAIGAMEAERLKGQS